MNFRYVLVPIAASVLFLTGCKDVEIKEGEIPASYVEAARVLEGTYSGQLMVSTNQRESEKRNAKLEIRIVGRRPVVTVSADWMGPGCGSSVGKLKRVEIGKGGTKVRRAYFAFDPGQCQGAGELFLNLFERTKEGRVKLTGWVNVASQRSSDNQRVEISNTDAMGRFVQD